MNSSLVIICVFLSLVAHMLASPQSNESNIVHQPRFDARVSALVARDVLQLAQEIGTTVLKTSTDKAVIFSPLSIFGVLSILLMGSNGQTYSELMHLLNFNEDPYLAQNSWKAHEEFGLLLEDIARDFPDPSHKRPIFWEGIRGPPPRRPFSTPNQNETLQKIAVGNGIFVQEGFSIRPDFRDAVEKIYRSTINNLDFSRGEVKAMNFMNEWVNQKTMGKITKLIDKPLPAETKLIIASALYFKAQWESTFIEELTRKRQFFPNGINEPSIVVDMMPLAITTPHYDSIEYDCQIIALPYKRRLTTMFIILPNNSSRQRLREFQASMSADKIDDMISKMEYKISVISIPKMHMISTLNLKTVFEEMGVHTLFRRGQGDLSLMSSDAGASDYSLSNVAPYAAAPKMQDRTMLLPYPGFQQDSDDRFIFSRVGAGDVTNATKTRKVRSAVTYKASSEFHQSKEPLRLKDLVLGKRITKSYPRKKTVSRGRRQAPIESDRDAGIRSLMNLDALRSLSRRNPLRNPGLFADEIIHKIDLTINEKGTEGGAVTYTTAVRTANVVFRADTPFMFIIRHDDTKLPLFYGSVFEPTSD